MPVFEVIDERLAERRGDGFRYEDLPEDPEAWRHSIVGAERRRREPTSDGRSRNSMPGNNATSSKRCDCARELAWAAGRTPLLPVDALRLQRLLCASVGLERDRLRRSRLSAAATSTLPSEPASRGRWKSVTPQDPVPWAKRAEAARRRHAEGLSSSDASHQGPDDE